MSAMLGEIAALMSAAKLVWRNFLMSLISSCMGESLLLSCWLLVLSVGHVDAVEVELELADVGALLSLFVGVFVFGFLGKDRNLLLSKEYVGCLI